MTASAATLAAFSQYASPISNPVAWDSIAVNGSTWTGKVEVRRASRAYRWQYKDPPGADGEFGTFRGKKGKTFVIVFYLWTDAHFANWATYQTNFYYQGAKAGIVAPNVVQHPALAYVGINAVTVEDIGAPERVSEDNLWKVEVAVREYMPPPPISVTNTPTGPAPTPPTAVPGKPPNPAIVALEQQIAALQANAAATGQPGGLP